MLAQSSTGSTGGPARGVLSAFHAALQLVQRSQGVTRLSALDFVVVDVVHAYGAPPNTRAAQVVNGQHGAALVLVRQERKAALLPGLLVPAQGSSIMLSVLSKAAL